MYYMRHGQSTFNVAEDATGRDPQIYDAPLTDLGRSQVAMAAQKIKALGTPIQQIISSPYTRAIQSAQIVAKRLDIPHVISPLVRERCLYSCDIGQEVEALKQQWPELDFTDVPMGEWWAPYGESHKSLKQRIHAFNKEWQFNELVDHTLIVSHYYYINGATGATPDNAEVIELAL